MKISTYDGHCVDVQNTKSSLKRKTVFFLFYIFAPQWVDDTMIRTELRLYYRFAGDDLCAPAENPAGKIARVCTGSSFIHHLNQKRMAHCDGFCGQTKQRPSGRWWLVAFCSTGVPRQSFIRRKYSALCDDKVNTFWFVSIYLFKILRESMLFFLLLQINFSLKIIYYLLHVLNDDFVRKRIRNLFFSLENSRTITICIVYTITKVDDII